MFIHLIFIFILLHYVLCDISCYYCPQVDNTFEYNIISTNIPTQLNNCSIHTEQLYCLVDIEWKQNPIIETNIRLAGGVPWRSSIDLSHSVEVNAYVPVSSERPRVKHFLRYICLTDECNRPANLKPLLESLTWTDKLEELEYLLESTGTFDYRWCLFFSNSTSLQQSSSDKVDPSDCKQCVTYVTDTRGIKEVVASCFALFFRGNKLTHQVTFNLDDRTRSDYWSIDCQRPDCNSMNTGDQIYHKNKLAFDINKFLDCTSGVLSRTFSLNLIFLTFLLLIILNK